MPFVPPPTDRQLAEELPHDATARRERLRELLRIMMGRPRSEHPYCIVTDAETSRFVQFAGSLEEQILLDVPALKVSTRYAIHDDFREPAEDGLALLQKQTRQQGRAIASVHWGS